MKRMEKEMRQEETGRKNGGLQTVRDPGKAGGTQMDQDPRKARPKVSICIPAYNNEPEVRRLLLSIAEQTMQDAEIILTDDSTDGAIEALAEEIRSGKQAEEAGTAPWTAPCMSRLRYVHNEKPLGHIFNWNKALSISANA